MNKSHIDMINSINNIIKAAKFKSIGQHVWGHQDDYCVYDDLDLWIQRKVDMDQLEKLLIFGKRKNKIKNKSMAMSKHEYFIVIIDKIKVTGDYINLIHDIIKGYQIMQYWNEQGRFPADQNKNIDWNVIRHARALLSFDRKIWMMKQVSGF